MSSNATRTPSIPAPTLLTDSTVATRIRPGHALGRVGASKNGRSGPHANCAANKARSAAANAQDTFDTGSPLLSLPPELRSRIWERCLSDGNPIPAYILRPMETSNSVPFRRSAQLKPNIHSLLAVCHQLREECAPMYFNHNLFVFPENGSHPLLQRWLLYPSVRAHTKHLRRLAFLTSARLDVPRGALQQVEFAIHIELIASNHINAYAHLGSECPLWWEGPCVCTPEAMNALMKLARREGDRSMRDPLLITAAKAWWSLLCGGALIVRRGCSGRSGPDGQPGCGKGRLEKSVISWRPGGRDERSR